jgi:antitoxin VapB
MQEIDEKVERLARLAAERGLGGILLNTQPNFAWLTGGRSNQIDGSRENGNGSLLVSARGQRFVVANNIEMPRLHDEALCGLGFSCREYAWTEEQAQPGTPIATARRTVGGEVGCDNLLPGGMPIESAIAATRAPLTPDEVIRYRALGRDMGHVLGGLCRALSPGLTEADVAQRVVSAVGSIGARAIVTLVAADDRIGRFRHPSPTSLPWQDRLLIAVCAQRHGLVAALSRVIVEGKVPEDLDARTRAAASVFGRLVAATIPGATGASLFSAAASAYADAGFAGEETRHHQGGATGYRSRDWVAHPASQDTVRSTQAFAWNPSITGTKVEETVLVTGECVEVLTSSPEWPSIPFAKNGQSLLAPGILSR